jgi:hypothetical protein
MAGNQTEKEAENRLGGLAALVTETAPEGEAPVSEWDPPYCGDIGLAIRADGTWTYRGSPIGRPALVNLFARVLRKDSDGKTYLVTPTEKVDVRVDDAPFLAVDMDVIGAGSAQQLVFRTNVDDEVACGPEHPLRFAVDAKTGAIKPYVLVRGRLEALVTRALTHALLEHAVENEPVGVRSGGVLFLVPDAMVPA